VAISAQQISASDAYRIYLLKGQIVEVILVALLSKDQE